MEIVQLFPFLPVPKTVGGKKISRQFLVLCASYKRDLLSTAKLKIIYTGKQFHLFFSSGIQDHFINNVHHPPAKKPG